MNQISSDQMGHGVALLSVSQPARQPASGPPLYYSSYMGYTLLNFCERHDDSVREGAENTQRGGGPSFLGGVRINFSIFRGGIYEF